MRTGVWCARRPSDGQADLLGSDMACFLGNPVFRPWDEWAMPGLSDRIIVHSVTC